MRISDWSSDVCSSDLRCSPDLSRACDGQEKTQIIPVHTPAYLQSHPAKSKHCNAAVIACMGVPNLQLKDDRCVTSSISSQATPSAAEAVSATFSIRTMAWFRLRRVRSEERRVGIEGVRTCR